MVAVVPSVARVPILSDEEATLLESLSRLGFSLTASFEGALAPMEEILAAKDFVYRRWVLDALLALVDAPLGFNDIARELGVKGEALSTKLAALEAAGLVRRDVVAPRPLRVRYELEPAGRETALAAFALTTGHTERVRWAIGSGDARVKLRPEPPSFLSGAAFEDGCRRYVATAERLRDLRTALAVGPSHEPAMATARRFTEMCVRRWHGETLHVLLTTGPKRYAELRAMLGAGDEALSIALRKLVEMRGIRKEGNLYAIEPAGAFAMALGGPVILFSWRGGRGRNSSVPASRTSASP
jgi:DNA-binding HxlR family transcriptional regulator